MQPPYRRRRLALRCQHVAAARYGPHERARHARPAASPGEAGAPAIAGTGAHRRPWLGGPATRGLPGRATAAGPPVSDSLVATVTAYHRRDGADAMRTLLATAEPPDAVFCFNDLRPSARCTRRPSTASRCPATSPWSASTAPRRAPTPVPATTTRPRHRRDRRAGRRAAGRARGRAGPHRARHAVLTAGSRQHGDRRRAKMTAWPTRTRPRTCSSSSGARWNAWA